MGIKVGDRVRFLNSIGGGIVKKIVSKEMVEVEDEDGFDIPTLISECVIVESKGAAEKIAERQQQKTNTQKPKQVLIQEEEDVADETYAETKEGELINAALGFVPVNPNMISQTDCEIYLINDSNYYLAYNIFNGGEKSVYSRYAGIINPNTKILLETMKKTQLNEFENLGAQIIAMKKDKAYSRKPVYDLKIKINTVKFYKLHSYVENDYFDEDAIIVPLVEKDIAAGFKLPSADDLKSAILGKEASESAKQSVKSNVVPEIIEVDLHINNLVDNTSGLSNKDMLDFQMKKVREVMDANLRRVGQKIVFIHGKGEGVLRNEVLKLLKSQYKKCYVQDASFLDYGFGATQVTIK